MEISIFLKLSLRAWNTVPEVTLNTVLQVFSVLLGAFEAVAAHRVAAQRSALGAVRLPLRLVPAKALKPIVGVFPSPAQGTDGQHLSVGAMGNGGGGDDGQVQAPEVESRHSGSAAEGRGEIRAVCVSS